MKIIINNFEKKSNFLKGGGSNQLHQLGVKDRPHQRTIEVDHSGLKMKISAIKNVFTRGCAITPKG